MLTGDAEIRLKVGKETVYKVKHNLPSDLQIKPEFNLPESDVTVKQGMTSFNLEWTIDSVTLQPGTLMSEGLRYVYVGCSLISAQHNALC